MQRIELLRRSSDQLIPLRQAPPFALCGRDVVFGEGHEPRRQVRLIDGRECLRRHGVKRIAWLVAARPRRRKPVGRCGVEIDL